MTKTKRRGGVYDETEIYINYSREELMAMIERTKNKIAKISEEESPTSSAFFNRLGEVNKHFVL